MFTEIFHKIGAGWRTFIKELQSLAESDDKAQIFFTDFKKTCEKYNVKISEAQYMNLLKSFPGRDEGAQKRVNIMRIYDQKYNMLLNKMYQKVDVHEDDGKDDGVDTAGYTGQFHRIKRKLTPISDIEFILLMLRKNKMHDMMLKIREIEKENTGFVTRTELDDILKIIYPDDLANRDLTALIKPFCSV